MTITLKDFLNYPILVITSLLQAKLAWLIYCYTCVTFARKIYSKCRFLANVCCKNNGVSTFQSKYAIY